VSVRPISSNSEISPGSGVGRQPVPWLLVHLEIDWNPDPTDFFRDFGISLTNPSFVNFKLRYPWMIFVASKTNLIGLGCLIIYQALRDIL
jgi:hypothetical protein